MFWYTSEIVRVFQQELIGMELAPKPSYAQKEMGWEAGPTKLFLAYVLADYEKTVQFFTDVGLLKA